MSDDDYNKSLAAPFLAQGLEQTQFQKYHSKNGHGFAAEDANTFADRVRGKPLGVASRELPLKPRKADSEMIAYADGIMTKTERLKGYHRHALKYAAYVERMGTGEYEVPRFVQVFRIGDLAIGTSPFETFTETGLEIKKRSPFAKVGRL
jgi:hypothetical protein